MKRPYRKHRWWHDRDAIELLTALAAVVAALALLLWTDWCRTAPREWLEPEPESGPTVPEPTQVLPIPTLRPPVPGTETRPPPTAPRRDRTARV